MDVPGLLIARNAIDCDVAKLVVGLIDEAPWRGDLRRRTQHYGYVYDYRAKTVLPEHRLGNLPPWALILAALVNRATSLDVAWDQTIVNEYEPGTGIGEHTDSRSFGPIIATVSLLSSTTMLFRRSYHAANPIPIEVHSGDVVIMSGPSRSPWTHEIRGADVTKRRISVTFRTVLTSTDPQ